MIDSGQIDSSKSGMRFLPPSRKSERAQLEIFRFKRLLTLKIVFLILDTILKHFTDWGLLLSTGNNRDQDSSDSRSLAHSRPFSNSAKMICSRRSFSTQAPAHAFQALSSGPGKKFPKSAQPKQWNLTQHGSQLKLATVDDLYSPISSLALVVQAGPRYQQGQEEVGVAQWLKTQGFKVGPGFCSRIF